MPRRHDDVMLSGFVCWPLGIDQVVDSLAVGPPRCEVRRASSEKAASECSNGRIAHASSVRDEEASEPRYRDAEMHCISARQFQDIKVTSGDCVVGDRFPQWVHDGRLTIRR